MLSNVLLIFGLVLMIMLAVFLYQRINKRKNIMKKIRETWGTEPKDKYFADDMTSIASYFENKKSLGEKDFLIDDITWNDLDMERVFKRINATHTSAGEEFLYSQLRTLIFDGDVLKERGRVIQFFQENPEERKKVQFVLEQVGKLRYANVSEYIVDVSQMSIGNSLLYRGLALLNLFCIPLAVYNMNTAGLLIISFIVNMMVYYRAKNRLDSQLNSVGYVARLVDLSKRILKLNIKGLEPYNIKLDACYKKLAKVGRAGYSFIRDSGGDPTTEYIKIVLLTDLNNYNKVLRLLKNNQQHFRELYETIGLIDSMISIASYRESVSLYSAPKLMKKTTKGPKCFKARDIYHPLIKDPITNSIELTHALLLTGSNASGKSTFLKSMALNAIFAQTIYTCLSREYSANYYKVLTSMALRDDLKNKESYFIAEIKSLKRICDAINDEYPCLCFIDEILRGTNTIERIASSSRALQFLAGANCMCVAATHDIELSQILGRTFENYHFRERISENEIIFDYKLYQGKSTTRNAIKLLGLMGFDHAIVKEAEKAAFDFEKDGTWGAVGQV